MTALFVVTHPRSMSTALERAFMTRPDLYCFHEPYGEPFYYGPERLSDRYSVDQIAQSQYSQVTYNDIATEIANKQKSSNVFIKDMAQYIVPPKGEAQIAKSFSQESAEEHNPTVIPKLILHGYKFVFLIRPPQLSVPSYYKCCIPPQSEKTGFDSFRPDEAGYRELRLLYDHLVKYDDTNNNFSPLIVDALDLAKNPEKVLKAVCDYAGIPFDYKMLEWGENEEVKERFAKWPGFHDTVLDSKGFDCSKNDAPNQDSSDFSTTDIDYECWNKKWTEKFGAEGAEIIEKTVKETIDDYIYLHQYKMKF